jgi:hypothetical protein
MNWVKKRVKTKLRNKARARVTEVGLAPVETLVVVEMEEAAEILAEAEVETLAVELAETLEEAEETPAEAVETSKIRGTGHRLQTHPAGVALSLTHLIPQGDRKGPHPAPHHPRLCYDTQRATILSSSL